MISTLFEGATIPTDLFLTCLVNMLVGRESIMFIWRRNSQKFVTKHFTQQIKVPGLSSQALQGLIEQCLEIGSLFTRLSHTAADISRMVTQHDSIMIALKSALTDILAALVNYIESLDMGIFCLLINLRPVATIVHLLANILGCGDLSRALTLQSLPDHVTLLSELYNRLSIYETSDVNLYLLTKEVFSRCLTPWMTKLGGIIGLNGSLYWKKPSEMVDSEMFVFLNNSGFLAVEKSKLPTFLTPQNAQICVEVLTALHILFGLNDTVVEVEEKKSEKSEQNGNTLIPPLDFDTSISRDAEVLLKPSALFSNTLAFLNGSKTTFDSTDPLASLHISIESQQQKVNLALMKHVTKHLYSHLETVKRFFFMSLGSADLCQLLFFENTVKIGQSQNWPPLNSDLRVCEDLSRDLMVEKDTKIWFGAPQDVDDVHSPDSICATEYVTVFYTPPEELKYVFLGHVIKSYQRIFQRLLKLARCAHFLQLQKRFTFHSVLKLQNFHFQVIDAEWYRMKSGVEETNNFMRVVNLHHVMMESIERRVFLFGEENTVLNEYLQKLLNDDPEEMPKGWRKLVEVK